MRKCILSPIFPPSILSSLVFSQSKHRVNVLSFPSARPAFYKYVTIMFSLNAIQLFACGLTANGAAFGFWLYCTTIVCYHAFYLPLLYKTFLADFFQEDGMHLENVYYSEMKDAGFFDADWE